MSKIPSVIITDSEGKVMTLTDCVLVGKTESEEELAISFTNTLNIPDTIKMLGSNIFLINTIMSTLQKTGVLPRKEMESLLALSTLLAGLKMQSAEVHTEVRGKNDPEKEEDSFEDILNFLKENQRREF